MNSPRLLPALGSLLAVVMTVQPATGQVDIHGKASVGPSTVVLDLVADTNGNALRAFGLQVRCDPGELAVDTASSYPGLWYLRGDDESVHSYDTAASPDPGSLRLLGAHFDGDLPEQGVGGEGVVLATVVFQRLNGNDPKFELDLAHPAPFRNFASTAGDDLDPDVKFHGITLQSAPVDTDNDGLPDPYETDVFGDLSTSDGDSDSDGDGESDRDEFVSGSDPTDPNSRLRLHIAMEPDGSRRLSWQGSADRVHTLVWSDTMGGFEVLVGGIVGAATEMQVLDPLPSATGRGFYRLETEYPTAGR